LSYIDRIAACAAPNLETYQPFIVDGLTVGYIKPAFSRVLGEYKDVFRIDDQMVRLAHGLEGFDARTDAVAGVLDTLMDRGDISGWRGERYPVGASFTAPALLEIERAAVPLFGTIGYGVHLNGIVEAADGFAMWIGRRSLSKPTGPGKLDQIVAGGQPTGISLIDNLIKECAEEADIPAELAASSIPVGAVTYVTERPEGLRRDVLFVYDLLLPSDFEPRNTDGEIEDFCLMSMAEVMERVQGTDDFKFNCALVVIDFLIRHGYLEPDHPEYDTLVHGLRRLK